MVVYEKTFLWSSCMETFFFLLLQACKDVEEIFYALKSKKSKLCLWFLYTKFSKHWPYLLAATIDFGCTKMLNQDVNLRLFISLYFTEMTVLSIFFQVIIVLGMYNFALFVIFAWVRDRFDGATNYHNFTAWIT